MTAPKQLVVRLMVCGLCKQQTEKRPEDWFRVSDSTRGRESMSEHQIDEHGVTVSER